VAAPRSRAPSSTRFQTIRFRLAAALAVALLPVLALGVLQSISAFHREAEHQRTDLVLGAERSAATARARLESAVVLLETLNPESVGLYCAPRLRQLAGKLHGYDLLARFDGAGRVVCASDSVRLRTAGPGGEWFAALRRGRPLVIARAPVEAGRPALLAAVRAERPLGGFDGAFVAAMPLSALAPTEQDRALPRGAEVAVVDAGGAVLTATDAKAFPAVRGRWTAEAARRGSTLFYDRDRAGRRRVYAGAPLADREVFVLLSSPAQGVFSWARLNPMITFVLPLLAWVSAVAAVLFVSERVVIRWLGYLERIASIYAKGRFSVRPVQARNAPLEIRNLAATLDQMADAIDTRDNSLRESLAHKDALMREIHHRVKNNLQVISSLLNMQQRSLSDPAARAAMSDTRQRITALSLIYRALYQSPDLKRVDVRLFLEELIAQLVSGDTTRGPLVRTELEADALVIDPDKLAPLALWAVEAITNAQKHAFEGRGGFLRVRFKVDGAESRLEVEDDGPGADDAAVGQGVGRTLMTAFARQLRGRVEIAAGPRGGVLATLIFPTPEAGDPALSGSAQPPSRPGAAEGNQAAA
jgi:two-component sensor histidine kinase